MIKVTFDSNIWEQVVDESKRNNLNTYALIYKQILNEEIEPYFFEGIVTLENIQKDLRKDFIANFKPTISIQVSDETPMVTSGTLPPELSDYLKATIPKALNIGFKFIRTPRIGGLGIDSLSEHAAKDGKYTLAERLNRTFDFLRFIENRGLGKGRLDTSISTSNGIGIIEKTRNDTFLTNKQYAKNVAEWVDGDALAAHHGYGIDYFCTNDRAKGAGLNSVFHPSNLNQIKQKYNIKVVTPDELSAIIQASV